MMEISNKTLAWLVVATIIASMAGTIISLNKINNSLTGYATSNTTGNVTVTIASTTSLTFAIGSLALGSGAIDGAYNNCTMYVNSTTLNATNKNAGCIGFSNSTWPLIIENNGNTVLNITLNFSNNASTFIGGAAVTPQFQFIIYNNETGSCNTLNSSLTSTFTEVTAAMVGQNMLACTGLNWSNTQDSIGIGVLVRIPADSSGTKQVNITAQGTG
jgi:hypothetical protein